MDWRSVKSWDDVDCEGGIEGKKKMKGGKEEIIVDRVGVGLGVGMDEGKVDERKGGGEVIEKVGYKLGGLVKMVGEGGYKGKLGDWVKKKLGWVLDVVVRGEECGRKFEVVGKGWIVEGCL